MTERDLIANLAEEFRRAMDRIAPSFTAAYWRFDCDEDHYGSEASVADSEGVSIVDAFEEAMVFERLNESGRVLWQRMSERGSGFKVALLTVSGRKHDLQFESEDGARWKITKSMGHSGVPLGL